MPRNPNLTAEQRAELAQHAPPPSRRAAFVKEQAELLGCAPSTIYRALESASPVRTRRRRSDAGSMKKMTEDVFLDLAALTVRYEFDAQLALDVMNANRAQAGLPPVDVVPETLREHLRGRQVSQRHNKKDLRVHRRWQAPYSNHTVQIDSTVAHCYYIDRDESIGHEPAVALNKNKAGNGRPRVWLIVMIDDYSRVVWARFYVSEAGLCWWDLMERSWRKPSDTSLWPAHGIPENVYSDCGSGLRSGQVRYALEQLGVEYDSAKPSTAEETNAQAKGKIERAVQLVQGFERLTKMRRFSSLAEMNAEFAKYLLWLNRQEHSVTGQSRFHRWIAGMQDQALRLMPPAEVTARLQLHTLERLIKSDLSIWIQKQNFQLPRREPFISYVNQKVPVLYRQHDLSRIIVVLDREEHEVDAVIAVPDVAGDFHAAPVPAAVELKRELQKRPLDHLDPHLVHDWRVAKTDERFVASLREVEHPLTAAAGAVRMVRRGKAQDRLAAQGLIATPPTAADKVRLDLLFAGRSELAEAELEEWITAEREAPRPRPAIALA